MTQIASQNAKCDAPQTQQKVADRGDLFILQILIFLLAYIQTTENRMMFYIMNIYIHIMHTSE